MKFKIFLKLVWVWVRIRRSDVLIIPRFSEYQEMFLRFKMFFKDVKYVLDGEYTDYFIFKKKLD
jgi:hypothetical protein